MLGLDDRHGDDAEHAEHQAPVWAAFGDLMAGLVGAFVLILVGVLVVQMDLVNSLQAEVRKREQEEQRRIDRKSTRLNSSHTDISRMPSSA